MNQRNIPFLEFNSSLSNHYLNLEKVNHVLSMFGHSLVPVANKDIEKNQD
jgi:hypothetical protein